MSRMLHMRKNSPNIVTNAREAFNKGFTKNVPFRLEQLKNFKKFLEENEEAIIDSIVEDLRKHRKEARFEIFIGISHIKYLLDNLKSWIIPETPPKRWLDLLDGIYVYKDPYGVVLVMGSWNAPLMTLLPVAGAIAAGNCVVIKPSHNSPFFGRMVELILPKYLNSECYPVFLGQSEETLKLLEERFDYIYYTGSSAFGKTVHLAANKYLTPTTLEMGGKNPVYIDPSADLEMAANRIMWGKCIHSGQICIAPDYILCDKKVEKEFIIHAGNALQKFYKNNKLKSCPIVNDYHFKRLQRLLNGLNVVIGGRTYPIENYIEPTVVTAVSPNDPIMQEEIFGPILPIVTINGFKEAVSFINKREKALTVYVFTKDFSVKDYFLENTSSGAVTVNDTLMHFINDSLPFGGVGFSGMGCYKSKYSFETFVHKKSVLVKNSSRIMEKINQIRYPPYSSLKSAIMEFLIMYRSGPSWTWLFYVSIFFIGFLVLLCYVII